MSDTLTRLAQVLEERKGAAADTSYVASLYHKGLNKILEKVGEESVETIIAAKDAAHSPFSMNWTGASVCLDTPRKPRVRPPEHHLERKRSMGIFDWKHWIVILVVVVLVFGTKKLKNLGTDVGESIKGFRKAMNDDEKPAEPGVPPTAQPAPPVQPQSAPLNQPHTIDVQAQKVEEPTRKDS